MKLLVCMIIACFCIVELKAMSSPEEFIIGKLKKSDNVLQKAKETKEREEKKSSLMAEYDSVFTELLENIGKTFPANYDSGSEDESSEKENLQVFLLNHTKEAWLSIIELLYMSKDQDVSNALHLPYNVMPVHKDGKPSSLAKNKVIVFLKISEIVKDISSQTLNDKDKADIYLFVIEKLHRYARKNIRYITSNEKIELKQCKNEAFEKNLDARQDMLQDNVNKELAAGTSSINSKKAFEIFSYRLTVGILVVALLFLERYELYKGVSFICE